MKYLMLNKKKDSMFFLIGLDFIGTFVQNIESEVNYSCQHVTYVSFPIIARG
jgi:hypothetical protein